MTAPERAEALIADKALQATRKQAIDLKAALDVRLLGAPDALPAFVRTGGEAMHDFAASETSVAKRCRDRPSIQISGLAICARRGRPSRRRARVARLLQPQLDPGRRYHTFRHIRIERAGADILCFGQFLPREVFRLQLGAKRFGRSREGSFPRWQLYGFK